MSHPVRWMPRAAAAPSAYLDNLPADLHPLIGQLLWNRGIQDPSCVASFLSADYVALHDAFAMRDMNRAVDRVRQAVERGETVAVYGDFDTDGVTGVALLAQVLTGLGLRVLPYIPRRIEEGYGLNMQAVEQLAAEVQLLITVDCGISNVREIARAQALGLDVIVLDHHTPPAVLPEGYAVVNPKRDGCQYPYKMLAGVGVAYKLIQALHKTGLRTSFKGRELLDVVALGTVTDMAPLDGENRILVKHGLVALNESSRPGIKALIDSAAARRPLDARTIGFSLGPRINAAGRLDDATRAYNLLLAVSDLEAQRLADELNAINIQRQALTKDVQRAAHELAISSGKHQRRIIVLNDAEFPAGVVGLVAARLVDVFKRPVLLLERGETTSRGSARSIAGFSIIDALTELGDLFDKFGGHAMAAGFTIANSRLDEFEARLHAIADRDLSDDLLMPRLHYDGELSLRQHSLDLLDHLALLEPYGQGNAAPVWITRGLRVLETRSVGKDAQHLKFRLADSTLVGDAIWWRGGEHAARFGRNGSVDVAYTLEANEYMGRRRVQMVVKDIRSSQV